MPHAKENMKLMLTRLARSVMRQVVNKKVRGKRHNVIGSPVFGVCYK